MMRSRRWLLGGAAAVVAGVIAIVVVYPRRLVSEAEELMAVDPCVQAAGPPGPGFYRAVDLAYRASKFPGVGRDRTDAAQSRCVGTFAIACNDIQSEAVTRSIHAMPPGMKDPEDWRRHVLPAERQAFCGAWARFVGFLRDAGDAGLAGCRYCVGWQQPE